MYAQLKKMIPVTNYSHKNEVPYQEVNTGHFPEAEQGYLFTPFAAPDLVDQSLGLNLLRHLKGKELYPIMTPNQDVRLKMETLRTTEIARLTTQINEASDQLQKLETTLKNQTDWDGNTLRNALSHEKFDTLAASIAKFSQQLSVLKKMKFSDNALSQLSPARDKLYILGHGGAGMNLLAADEAMTLGHVTAKELAKQMSGGGLPKTFRDIRMTACYSADAIKPMSFSSQELNETAGAYIKKPGMLRGIFNPPRDITPLAQSISHELNQLGYDRTQITGYHGAGVTFSKDEFRTRRIEGSPDIRRSLVKRIF